MAEINFTDLVKRIKYCPHCGKETIFVERNMSMRCPEDVGEFELTAINSANGSAIYNFTWYEPV